MEQNIKITEDQINASIKCLEEALANLHAAETIDSEIVNVFLSNINELLIMIQNVIDGILDNYNNGKIDKQLLDRLMGRQIEAQKLAKEIMDFCK